MRREIVQSGCDRLVVRRANTSANILTRRLMIMIRDRFSVLVHTTRDNDRHGRTLLIVIIQMHVLIESIDCGGDLLFHRRSL